jgi:hypothetical protein
VPDEAALSGEFDSLDRCSLLLYWYYSTHTDTELRARTGSRAQPISLDRCSLLLYWYYSTHTDTELRARRGSRAQPSAASLIA